MGRELTCSVHSHSGRQVTPNTWVSKGLETFLGPGQFLHHEGKATAQVQGFGPEISGLSCLSPRGHKSDIWLLQWTQGQELCPANLLLADYTTSHRRWAEIMEDGARGGWVSGWARTRTSPTVSKGTRTLPSLRANTVHIPQEPARVGQSLVILDRVS